MLWSLSGILTGSQANEVGLCLAFGIVGLVVGAFMVATAQIGNLGGCLSLIIGDFKWLI